MRGRNDSNTASQGQRGVKGGVKSVQPRGFEIGRALRTSWEEQVAEKKGGSLFTFEI